MSGRVGLREDARVGHLLAQRIADLFRQARSPRIEHAPSARHNDG